jgi:MobA/MobL family
LEPLFVAIAYLRINFPRLLPHGGAAKLLAYLGRYRVVDWRLRRVFSFEGIARDLVYDEVILPNGAPAEYANPARLAHEIDAAEARRMRSFKDRERWPQIGAAFILALPPDSELTYDQVIELSHRLVEHIRQDLPLAIYIAIHDPARVEPGAVNRHLHLLVTLRGLGPVGFMLHKIRGLFARPRAAKAPKVRTNYVAEGVHWPRVTRDLLESYFLELGLDLTVDPHLPVGHRHWPAATIRDEPQRVEEHRRMIHERNEEIVLGEASHLVDSLLRGRTTVSVDEIRRILVPFIDRESDREFRLNQILGDPEIITYSLHAEDPRATRLTTRAIHRLITSATEIIDRIAEVDSKPFVVAISETNATAVMHQLTVRIQQQSPGRRVLLAGLAYSHSADLRDQLETIDCVVTTINSLLKPKTPNSPEDPLEIEPNDLIAVTRSEQVDDESLAKLIVAAANCGAQLMLGYDESRRTSVVRNGLARWITERIKYSLPEELEPEDTLRLLRCGRVDHALWLLDQHGSLQFEADDPPSGRAPEFILCDDMHQLAQMNTGDRVTNAIKLEYGLYTFAPHDWVAFTDTDYSQIPPTIRKGRLAQVVGILPEGWRILVRHPDDTLQEIDLQNFSHVRTARAISIAEARHAPANARLEIRLTKARRAWSVLHLAAARGDGTVVRISPLVARNLEELKAVTRRNLPAALPTELLVRPDSPTEVMQILMNAAAPPSLAPSLGDEAAFDLEIFPVPDENGRWQVNPEPSPEHGVVGIDTEPSSFSKHEGSVHPFPADNFVPQHFFETNYVTPLQTQIPHGVLHEKLWASLALTPDGQLLLGRLEDALHPEAPNRDDTYENLRQLTSLAAPTLELIQIIMDLGTRRAVPWAGDIDAEIEGDENLRRPREWSPAEIHAFERDIEAFARPSSLLNAAFNPPQETGSKPPGPATF